LPVKAEQSALIGKTGGLEYTLEHYEVLSEKASLYLVQAYGYFFGFGLMRSQPSALCWQSKLDTPII
jgi:hypothetical protein